MNCGVGGKNTIWGDSMKKVSLIAIALIGLFSMFPSKVSNSSQSHIVMADEKVPSVHIGDDKLQVFEFTAYTAGYESTQKHKGDAGYGITASGKKVQEGMTIACPRSMPFGTKVVVPELDASFECQDRGGAITEGHIDLFMNNLKDAQTFGRQKFEVVVIRK